MKKSFLYVMAVIGVLTACSDSDSYSVSENTENNNLVPVSFKVASQGLSQDLLMGKGTGTVGDTVEETNVWKGQYVRVYMMNKGTLNPTTVTIGTVESSFNNTLVKTPYGVATGPAYRADERQCYYPVTGASDFWGYRTDGAETGDPETTDCEMRVPFKIDGTQDMMAGKTATVEGDIPSSALFSAYSAREGIVPNIVFDHMLTRLTFSAKCYGGYKQYGSNADKIAISEVDADDPIVLPDGTVTTSKAIAYKEATPDGYVNKGLYIDSVLVESATSGKMYFAWTPMANMRDDLGYARIAWNQNTEEFLSLKQRPTKAMYFKEHPEMDPSAPVDVDTLDLVNLVGIQPNELENVKIGEAMMVAPQNKYKIKVFMHQYLEKYDQDALDAYYQKTGHRREQRYILQQVLFPNPDVAEYYEVDVKTAVGDNVKAGYSYNIHLNVVGTERIDLEATLTPWKNGGNTDIDLE